MNNCIDFNVKLNLENAYKKYCDGSLSQSDFTDYISRLIKDFNIVDVLYCISQVIPFSASINIFDKIKFNHQKKEIKSIAVCIDQCYLGGRARVNSILVDMWIRLGYHVVVFSDEFHPSDFKYSELAKRIVFPMPREDIRGRLFFLKEHCEEEKIDILISHCWLNYNNLYDIFLLKSLGIYCLNYAHGVFTNILQYGNPLDLVNLFKCYDLVLCLSEMDYCFYTSNDINACLIDNPISDDLKRNRRTSNLKNNIISIIGRIDNDKLPFDSLKIFKNVHNIQPGIKFNIVGRGDSAIVRQVRKYIKENNLTDCVDIYLNISPDKIYDFYLKSDCILFTSPSEGYPMVLLEACCFGVPVCMYELPYLAFAKNNKGILSSRCYDIDDLSNKLIKLMNDDNSRIRAGKNARLFFLELAKHNIEKTWIDIFKNLTRGNILKPQKKSNGNNRGELLAIPLLLNVAKNLYFRYARISNNKDYKVGRVVNYLPRKIIRFLRKLFHHKN